MFGYICLQFAAKLGAKFAADPVQWTAPRSPVRRDTAIIYCESGQVNRVNTVSARVNSQSTVKWGSTGGQRLNRASDAGANPS